MVIRAYKVAADGTQSIVELEVSEKWYPEPDEPEGSTQTQLLDNSQAKVSSVKELRTIAIISNTKSESITKAK